MIVLKMKAHQPGALPLGDTTAVAAAWHSQDNLVVCSLNWSSEGRRWSFAGKAQMCPLAHTEVLMLEEAPGQEGVIPAQTSAVTSVAGLAVSSLGV